MKLKDIINEEYSKESILDMSIDFILKLKYEIDKKNTEEKVSKYENYEKKYFLNDTREYIELFYIDEILETFDTGFSTLIDASGEALFIKKLSKQLSVQYVDDEVQIDCDNIDNWIEITKEEFEIHKQKALNIIDNYCEDIFILKENYL